jgi:ankyrin repeat protein
MALSLTTQRDAEGAFTLPPDYGSYGKHLKALSRYFNKGNGSAKADPSVVSSVILSVALIAAVAKRDAISAEALLSVGANASCVDENLRTPAHYASRGGDVAMLAMLFDHGKDFYYALLHLK